MPSLTYLNRFKIKDKDAGLKEPSGLSLDHGGDGLWTVSDDTKRVFRLTLDGELKPEQSFEVPEKDLEGIAIDPTGKRLFAVREKTNKILELCIASRTVANQHRLARMEGYETISRFFEDDPKNKGLEGITWNTDSATLFVLKEGDPGLLIEVTRDLETILGHVVLNPANGFVDPGTQGRKIDYSGLCYDSSRKAYWIVSDKARRIYLYDAGADRVVFDAALGYSMNGGYREIESAEGVAYEPRSGRLYIVSDDEARLYVYQVRP